LKVNINAHLSLFIVNLIYGANFIIAKGLMPNLIGPSGFILVRLFGALPLFFLVKVFIKEKIDKADFELIAVGGFFGVALNQMLFFNGLNLTSPLNASLIMLATPVMVMIISGIYLKEKITKNKIAGLVFGLTGAFLLIISSSKTDASASPIGDLFILINALSYAVFLVLIKPLMFKYKPITVISYVFLFGSIYVLPFGWNQFAAIQWKEMELNNYLGVGFVVVFTTFLAYLLNIYSLKHLRPDVVSIYIYLQPMLAILFGWLFFILQPSGFIITSPPEINVIKIFCAAMIFLGVYLVSKTRRQ
jgi:drug/metabolite transporter (DMT)-like permease